MFRKLMFICLVLLSCVLASAATAETTTVMVYMCGSNLETLYNAATKDVQEMQYSGLDSSQTRVYFMAGGSKEWKYKDNISKQGGLYTLIKKKKDDTVNLKALEEEKAGMNMGEQDTLTWFLNYCAEHSQTDRYALILWDHGGGPVNGVCWDEQYGGDHLTLEELIGALAASPFAEKKLSWIGFDACLMSTVEVASKMSPYAEYMIASQAEEPSSGWNYAFLKNLEKDRDGAETGRRIVEDYFSVSQKTAQDLTMACINLSKIAAVEASMDAMYQDMTAQLSVDTFSSIAKLRQTATGFGKSADYQRSSSGYDLVDVVSLSACYADKNPEGAEKVRQAVRDAVVYSQANMKDCNGLSVYHPFRNQKSFLTEWSEVYKSLNFCPGYTAYVNAYGRIMTGEHLVRWNDLTGIRAMEDESGSLVTLNITEQQAANLASARLVVLARNIYDDVDSAYFRMFSTANVYIEDTLLAASYNEEAMQVLYESGSEPITGAISYRVTEDGAYLVDIYPIEDDLSRHETPIIAEYVLNDHGRLELNGYLVYDEMTGAYSRRAEVDLSQYHGITFLNEYRVQHANIMGEYLAFDEWPLDAHADKQWKARYDIDEDQFMLSIEKLEVLSEELYAAYEITDTQGNVYMTELVPLSSGGTDQYPLELEIGNEIPSVSASVTVSHTSGTLKLELHLTNTADSEQMYSLNELALNGTELSGFTYQITGGTGGSSRFERKKNLRPGETGKLIVELKKEYIQDLNLGEAPRSVAGRILVYENGETSSSYRFEFGIETAIPLDALLFAAGKTGKADETIDLPVAAPTLSGVPLESLVTASAYTLGGSYDKNAKVIINITMENVTDKDLEFFVQDVFINGVAMANVYALNGYGTGDVNALGKNMVAPGETVTGNMILRYADIAALMPDVSLQEIRCVLLIKNSMRIDGEETHQYPSVTPVHFKMNVPLTSFYDDTESLPAQRLVDLRDRYGAFSEKNTASLFEYGDFSISLHGIFGVERSCVLLLRMENHGGYQARFSLGQAALDGREAIMGRDTNVSINIRNSRVNAFGLDKEIWDAPTGVCVSLNPGEGKYCYVMVKPASDDMQEAQNLSFHAYLVGNAGSNLVTAYSDAIEISAAAPMRFEQGKQWLMPAGAFAIKPGAAVPKNKESIQFAAAVITPDPDAIRPIPLKLNPSEGDQIKKANYMILRRIRSDRELAEMNIENNTSDETGGSEISFADGREWMRLMVGGSLHPAEDGCSASGIFYGLYPAAVNGSESMPLKAQISEEGSENTIRFDQIGSVRFLSASFPSMVINDAVYAVSIAYDLQTGAARYLDSRHLDGDYVFLSEIAQQQVSFHPLDSTPEKLLRFFYTIEGIEEYEQNQIMRLFRPELQLAVESIIDPADYYVVFIYQNQNDEEICTLPRLLSDFVE